MNGNLLEIKLNITDLDSVLFEANKTITSVENKEQVGSAVSVDKDHYYDNTIPKASGASSSSDSTVADSVTSSALVTSIASTTVDVSSDKLPHVAAKATE